MLVMKSMSLPRVSFHSCSALSELCWNLDKKLRLERPDICEESASSIR